ncbi:MAG: hypothetical protein COS99_06195 [Candidatus Omnitrophica bacterium CG07_land_8_20_14_0_80_42_15]|uniref:Alkaline shock response membrane anchor protein AmaP n=1 Tax=Candidatus Aquitaenariimonas noxiae TaxID=1974741 RepID=A0A2J0KZP6_9BACT|nr:MAG: hypothetical protein COS99_06195 [Candidatus Omnitrophica bacterium CG07_land_8_20_14_0_80_42_15]
MKILEGFAIIFYTIVCLALGFALVVLAFNTLPIESVENMLGTIYTNPNTRFMMGGIGIGVILIGLVIAQITSGKIQRERTIAFENPDGPVVISLSAVEDLIKRIVHQIPEIKDLKPSVAATKKGVNVVNRVILFSGANIPEVTEKMQSMIKLKVQEMLGIEEPVIVKVHVTKISAQTKQQEKRRDDKENMPQVFKGIEYGTD